MKTSVSHFLLTATLFAPGAAIADTHYVSVNSINPFPPYTNWATAATVIQDAVDAASSGDTVLVTNGVYSVGGSGISGTITNRVVVDRAIRLESVMGPATTIIEGSHASTNILGDDAVRCVYLTNGASLIGFTLTNGATAEVGTNLLDVCGGGIFFDSTNATASNCVVVGNAAGVYGGGAFGGVLLGCTVRDNTTGVFGAGAFESFLSGCLILSNAAATDGGGCTFSTLVDCTLIGNSGRFGGGAHVSSLVDCVLFGNQASENGGGSFSGSLNRCTIISNVAGMFGGGAYRGFVTNCVLSENRALSGGGAYGANGAFVGCTFVGNKASGSGGGLHQGEPKNCILFYNSAPSGANYDSLLLDHCCTIPLPANGVGNIANAPLFVETNGWADLRLLSNSPCINAGNTTYVTTTNDLDGDLRIVGGAVDMGAYEFQSPASTISYAWLQQYGLPTDGSVDHEDGDGDQATTWQEWKMWTIPTNGLSVLRMLGVDPTPSGVQLSWESVGGHSYMLERASDGAGSFSVVHSNILGQPGTTLFTDTAATNGNAFLYRVSVPE